MSKHNKINKMTERLNKIHLEHYKQQSHHFRCDSPLWWEQGPNLAAADMLIRKVLVGERKC